MAWNLRGFVGMFFAGFRANGEIVQARQAGEQIGREIGEAFGAGLQAGIAASLTSMRSQMLALPSPEQDEPVEAEYTVAPAEDYSALPWRELRALAKERGILTTGKKRPDIEAALAE